MKKLLALLLAALMIVSFAACSGDDGDGDGEMDGYVDDSTVKTFETIGDDTFTFEPVDTLTVIITGFSSTNDAPHEVKIPAYLDGKQVVALDNEAFCYKSNISKITFPSEADYKAKDEAFDLAAFSFSIGNYTFRDCISLTEIKLPAYVKSIGKGLFYGCSALQEFPLDATTTLDAIPDYTFMSCTSLSTLTLPDNFKTVGTGAFFECVALESVTLSEGVEMVLPQAFQNCTALASVKLPESLLSVGKYAFHGSDALYKGGVVYAGDSADVLSYISGMGLVDQPVEDTSSSLEPSSDSSSTPAPAPAPTPAA